MGVSQRGRSPGELKLGRLDQHGYRWVVVDEAAAPEGRALMRSQLGRPVSECEGYAVFDIRAPARGPLE